MSNLNLKFGPHRLNRARAKKISRIEKDLSVIQINEIERLKELGKNSPIQF